LETTLAGTYMPAQTHYAVEEEKMKTEGKKRARTLINANNWRPRQNKSFRAAKDAGRALNTGRTVAGDVFVLGQGSRSHLIWSRKSGLRPRAAGKKS